MQTTHTTCWFGGLLWCDCTLPWPHQSQGIQEHHYPPQLQVCQVLQVGHPGRGPLGVPLVHRVLYQAIQVLPSLQMDPVNLKVGTILHRLIINRLNHLWLLLKHYFCHTKNLTEIQAVVNDIHKTFTLLQGRTLTASWCNFFKYYCKFINICRYLYFCGLETRPCSRGLIFAFQLRSS